MPEKYRIFNVMVYVDSLVDYGGCFNKRFGPSCHMLADTEEELHSMAMKIGMKKAWFQHGDGQQAPHYDLVASRRKQAIKHGAIEIDRKQLGEMLTKWRASRI